MVKDTSGAVMPGVTVEASSPALIEKTRSVVTDNAGQYKIVDLSPGTYDVSFTLAGFKTVKRANLLLEGNVQPTVNAELQVGSLEEVLTVTAESPIVDVVNNQQSFVATREVLDAIPTTRRDTTARALLIPGTTVTPFVLGQYNLTSHGSSTSDFTIAVDGIRINNLCGSGQYSGFYMNDAAIQELTYSTGSESAEIQSSGIRVNSVPRDGGNKFSGSFFLYGQKGCAATSTNGCFMAADNRSDAAKAAGITIAGTAYDWQINPSFGGPIVRDKLWFYATYKYQDNKIYVPSAHFPDGSPAYRNSMGNYSGVGRVTWAASSKDKIRLYVEKQFNGEFYNGFVTYPFSTPEAATDGFGGGWDPNIRWTRAQSNKLLLEAGLSYYTLPYGQSCHAGLSATALPSLNGSTGLVTGGCGYLTPPYSSTSDVYASMASASYVTGSHAMKFGMTDSWGENSRTFAPNANIDTLIKVNVRFRASATSRFPVPGRGLQLAGDVDPERQQRLRQLRPGHLDDEAADAELRRALRALQRLDSGAVVASVDLDRRAQLPGRSRRAELERLGGPLRGRLRPVRHRQDRAQGQRRQVRRLAGGRLRADVQRHERRDPDRQLDRPLAQRHHLRCRRQHRGQRGRRARTANYGQVTSRPDPALARGNNWEYSAVLQHELFPRTSVTAGYYRRDFYNLQVNDNQNVALTDWSAPFTISTPTDPRLPLSGQAIPLYNLNAGKVGVATDTLVTYSTANKTTYNGVEFTANVRRDKFIVFGGVTTDKRTTITCDGDTTATTARDTPNGARFCDAVPPFRTTVKASARLLVPVRHQPERIVLVDSGTERDRELHGHRRRSPAARSSASPAGANSIVVNLVQPGTVFLDYQNRLDLRARQDVQVRPHARFRASWTSSTCSTRARRSRVNQTYAASGTNLWMSPTTIMDGRYLRFGMQLNF